MTSDTGGGYGQVTIVAYYLNALSVAELTQLTQICKFIYLFTCTYTCTHTYIHIEINTCLYLVRQLRTFTYHLIFQKSYKILCFPCLGCAMQSHELDKELDVRKSPQGLQIVSNVSRSYSFPDLGEFFFCQLLFLCRKILSNDMHMLRVFTVTEYI